MSHPNQVPDEPLAEAGREPLRQAIAGARHERRGGISVQTLGIAAVASAAASYTVSHVWGPGTMASAALTPVIVALVSEFLHRPVNKVASTAARVAPLPPPLRPPAPPPVPGREPEPEPAGDWTPIAYSSTPQPRRRPRWRLVLLTGLLAFVIVVGAYTLPDLVLGHSITGSCGSTTFFSSCASTPTVQVHVKTVTTPAPTPPAVSAPTTSTPTTPLPLQTAPQQTTPTTPTAPSTTDTTPSTPTDTTSVPTTPSSP